MHIDHLVICVPDLDNAISYYQEKLGVTIYRGGRHLDQGTKNAIIPMREQAYIELLAVDEENDTILTPRWMGVDEVTQSTFSRWCLKTNELKSKENVLRKYNPQMSEVIQGSRKTASGDLLRWQMIKPYSSPLVEVIPFYVDWSGSAVHPSQMGEAQISVLKLEVSHPNPEMIKQVYHDLELDMDVQKSNTPKLQIHIESPNGSAIL